MPTQRIRGSAWTNYVLLFACYAILTPYLQLFLKARGLPLSHIGLLLGTLELAGIGGPIVLGHLADTRAAYRLVLFAGLVISVIVFIPLQLTTALPVFLACITVMGFFYRASIPLLDSLVGRILPDPARQYGRLRVAGSISFTIVSVVLQLTGAISGDSALSILASFGTATGLAALAVWLIPAAHTAGKRWEAVEGATDGSGFDLRFWTVIGIIFLGRFGLGGYYSFFSLYVRDSFGLSGVGLLWAIGSLAEIPMVFFSGNLIRRLGVRMLLAVSLAAVSLRLGMFILAPSIVVVALAQLLHAFTFGTFHTASVAYVNSRVTPARRGVGMAVYNAVGGGLPTFLAASLGGLFLEARGYRSLFLVYALVPLAGVAMLVLLGKRILPPSDSLRGNVRVRGGAATLPLR
jgi:PPP family 3-phenylpropionic acid transporter